MALLQLRNNLLCGLRFSCTGRSRHEDRDRRLLRRVYVRVGEFSAPRMLVFLRIRNRLVLNFLLLFGHLSVRRSKTTFSWDDGVSEPRALGVPVRMIVAQELRGVKRRVDAG